MAYRRYNVDIRERLLELNELFVAVGDDALTNGAAPLPTPQPFCSLHLRNHLHDIVHLTDT